MVERRQSERRHSPKREAREAARERAYRVLLTGCATTDPHKAFMAALDEYEHELGGIAAKYGF